MPLAHVHIHDNVARAAEPQNFQDQAAQDVVLQTVYHTLSKTFDGPIAGYTTIAQHDVPSRTVKEVPAPTHLEPQKEKLEKNEELQEATGKPTAGTETAIPTVIKNPGTTNAGTVLNEATGTAYLKTSSSEAGVDKTTSVVVPEMTSSSSVPSSTGSTDSSDSTTSSEGLSSGATAGIVFGILGGLLLIGGIIFLVYSRRKKNARRFNRGMDDEKLHGPMANAAPLTNLHSDPKAPRVSLRPVTQFFPNFNMERRSSKGAAMALSPAGGNGWDRPSTSQSMHPNNPFGNQAERIPSPVTEEHSLHERSLPPTPAHESVEDPFASRGRRVTSMRKEGLKNLDLTAPYTSMMGAPASPAGTEFSINSVGSNYDEPPTAGAAAIAAAGGPPKSAVHRVQLDFKPTLEDELELQAGQLVRLLHEYDDGWALCIRLDRSQQGVVPRTCLSTRPVKPRPAPGGGPRGPPVNPSGPYRGPRGPPGRPMTPQGYGRPESPAGRPRAGTATRPMSPAGRPMSPGGRPMSPAGAARPGYGPGPSPMNPSSASAPGPPMPGQAY